MVNHEKGKLGLGVVSEPKEQLEFDTNLQSIVFRSKRLPNRFEQAPAQHQMLDPGCTAFVF